MTIAVDVVKEVVGDLEGLDAGEKSRLFVILNRIGAGSEDPRQVAREMNVFMEKASGRAAPAFRYLIHAAVPDPVREQMTSIEIVEQGFPPEQLFSAYSSYARQALNSLFIMNGGAAVALIAFLGEVTGAADQAVSPERVTAAVLVFAAGALFAVLAGALAYVAELTNHQRVLRREKPSGRIGAAAIVFAFSGGLCFIFGCLNAVLPMGWHGFL